MISDAVDNYLVSSEKDASKQTEAFDQPQMESLKKENRLLKALIDTLPKPSNFRLRFCSTRKVDFWT
jgi:hypothetical protein